MGRRARFHADETRRQLLFREIAATITKSLALTINKSNQTTGFTSTAPASAVVGGDLYADGHPDVRADRAADD
jgi:hypothetical protein